MNYFFPHTFSIHSPIFAAIVYANRNKVPIRYANAVFASAAGPRKDGN
jgi:hypothetical protein